VLNVRIAIAPLLTSVLLAFPSAAAAASPTPECKVIDPRSGLCLVTVKVPGSGGAKPVNNPGSGAGGAEQGQACQDGPSAVACSDPLYGTWSNAMQCYLQALQPQPDASDPRWEGRYPEGAIYNCVNPGVTGGSRTAVFWLPGPPEAPTISPAQAARIVVARMDLKAADIGIVPEDAPGRIGAVGAPVYMWTTPGPTTFGPQVLTGSAGGVTITATARVDRIVWSMGDGTSVTCRTPGTVYQDRFGFDPSPDCGHRYSRTSAGQPDDAYPVLATSFWVVDWTGPGGSSGQITLELTSSTSIRVGELQALVTG